MSRAAEILWKPIRWWWNASAGEGWAAMGAVFIPIIGIYLLIEGDWLGGILCVLSLPLWLLLWVYAARVARERRTRR